jgi:TrmH family RNA methyltransferase
MRGETFTIERVASRQNPRLKDLRQRLADRGPEDGWLAIEGENLLQEAARSGLSIRALFLREGHPWLENGAPFPADAVLTVPGDVFASACGTQAPQGVAAIVRQPQWTLDALLAAVAPRLIILDGIQDPGNAGTIIRTAEAFGATGVLLLPPAVGPWRQKVLRASAGSSFRLPVLALDGPQALRRVQASGIAVYGCAAHEGASIAQAAIGGRWAMVIGSEGSGLSKAVAALCDGMLRIPCPGPVESLNAATAAAILLYAASRQRAEA